MRRSPRACAGCTGAGRRGRGKEAAQSRRCFCDVACDPLDRNVQGVAAVEQVTRRSRQLPKAVVEGTLLKIEIGLGMHHGLGEERQHVVVKNQLLTAERLAVGQYLEPDDAVGPAREVADLRRLAGLLPEHKVRLLKHVGGLIRVPQQRKDIRIDPALMPGDLLLGRRVHRPPGGYSTRPPPLRGGASIMK